MSFARNVARQCCRKNVSQEYLTHSTVYRVVLSGRSSLFLEF